VLRAQDLDDGSVFVLRFECQMYKARDDEYVIDIQVGWDWGSRTSLGRALLSCCSLAGSRPYSSATLLLRSESEESCSCSWT
jgi:hypothetical protein